ncbi:MAG TPA: YidC/Oxa1 family membrane protein insertase [Solirubrobacteraceae bacterium]|nr:YidC/Oxa1 family membrane protein insertase [Solirubrobacteraceae bacterium]
MLVFANIFQPLIDIFEAVIKFFHNGLGVPWGWSIVLLTVVMRALLLPLAIKQFHSMQRMQAHMPELKQIQAKYKDDKQRLNQEVMKFYQENKVNPFGSCAPLLAQIPVFIGLFYMLRKQLRRDICPGIQTKTIVNGHTVIGTSKPCGSHGASFLFIHDLTTNAAGVTLVVLIVLYIGTMLASSLMMSAPTMDRNQRIMVLLMPLLFVVFIIRFPAGVLVYWITTNLWTMGQQYLIRRRLGPTPVVATTGGGTATNGIGAGAPSAGGLLGRLRAAQPQDGAATATKEKPAATPPPPPRKKKKRSGRRR